MLLNKELLEGLSFTKKLILQVKNTPELHNIELDDISMIRCSNNETYLFLTRLFNTIKSNIKMISYISNDVTKEVEYTDSKIRKKTVKWEQANKPDVYGYTIFKW